MKPISHTLLIAAFGMILPFGAIAQHPDGNSPQSSASADAPLWSQADQYYDPEEMAKSREEVLKEGGSQNTSYVLFNQFEAQSANGADELYWNGQAWYGGDINKIWLKTEGRSSLNNGDVEDAEIQALYSRAVAPYWNLQAGVRHDFKPDSLDHAVIGIQGLAPYFFEVDMSAYLSTEGDVTARAELEYELLLTQRLILQPRIEANVSAQDIPDRQIGAGLNNIDAGVRLRYEIKRQFAPYIGVEWQGTFGDTKDFIETTGGDADRTVFVAGVRTWF
jgi:copper resistance protein B